MGYLQDKSVYLCGAMSLATDDGIGWRDYVIPKLKSVGVDIADPTRKTTAGISEVGDDKEHFRELILEEKFDDLKDKFMPVARWDLRSVDKADFLIVCYDPNIPSVGTIDEITIANLQRKPILVKYDKTQLDKFNPWIIVRVKPENLFSSWEAMFDYLTNVDNGIDIDKDLWTL